MLIYALGIAVVSVAWCTIIAMETPIFKQLNTVIYEQLPEYIWKPLVGCYKCFAGQVALWGYFLLLEGCYNIFNHILFISVAIVASVFINRTINE